MMASRWPNVQTHCTLQNQSKITGIDEVESQEIWMNLNHGGDADDLAWMNVSIIKSMIDAHCIIGNQATNYQFHQLYYRVCFSTKSEIDSTAILTSTTTTPWPTFHSPVRGSASFLSHFYPVSLFCFSHFGFGFFLKTKTTTSSR